MALGMMKNGKTTPKDGKMTNAIHERLEKEKEEAALLINGNNQLIIFSGWEGSDAIFQIGTCEYCVRRDFYEWLFHERNQGEKTFIGKWKTPLCRPSLKWDASDAQDALKKFLKI